MDHLQACQVCKFFNEDWTCSVYRDTDWVNRRGGCPMLSYREVPRAYGVYVDGVIVKGNQRPGQQKQKKADR